MYCYYLILQVCDKLHSDDGSDAAEHSLHLFEMLTDNTRSDIGGMCFDFVTWRFGGNLITSENDEVCIAFSGGIDSLLVTYTVLRAAPITLHTVTLINVAFGEDDKVSMNLFLNVSNGTCIISRHVTLPQTA